jgi:hypothetical protein
LIAPKQLSIGALPLADYSIEPCSTEPIIGFARQFSFRLMDWIIPPQQADDLPPAAVFDKLDAVDAPRRRNARLRKGLLDKSNTASNVWADTAYRSAANEAFMKKNGFVSRVHRNKPKGRPMPNAVRRANAAKSKIRSRVEHVFAEQKDRMRLFIRTIGIARAKVKIGNAV